MTTRRTNGARALGYVGTGALVVALSALGPVGTASAQSADPTQPPQPSPRPPPAAPPAAPTSTPLSQPPSWSGTSGSGPRIGLSSTDAAKPAPQGFAVLATNGARDEAFALARALYGSRLRPTALDEVRARVLAGDPPPANASRELRELAELRAGVRGEDAASRRLLAGIAQQVGAQGLLVVHIETVVPTATEETAPSGGADADAGGAAASPAPAPPVPTKRVVARLVLADTGEVDAAQYSPDSEGGWKGTIAALEGRFPPVARANAPAGATTAAPALKPDEEKSRPFYASGWFWGALGAAALLAGAFYLGTRDTSSDSIHLEMRVPK